MRLINIFTFITTIGLSLAQCRMLLKIYIKLYILKLFNFI